ncbi:MAG: hypothetical protein ISR72_07675 [Methylobacter sp.]|nr:hypothetical protein [Methylobacter sp.]
MNSINSNRRHKKSEISGNGDCRVVFCPECGVLEINCGTSTIRTNYESLIILSSVLNHAKVRLDQIQNTTPEDNAQQISIRRVH